MSHTTNHCIFKGDMKNVPIPKGHSFEKLLEVFVDEDYTKYDVHQVSVSIYIPSGKKFNH